MARVNPRLKYLLIKTDRGLTSVMKDRHGCVLVLALGLTFAEAVPRMYGITVLADPGTSDVVKVPGMLSHSPDYTHPQIWDGQEWKTYTP